MREEPQYQVFEYTCPNCHAEYREASSVMLHPDHRICPKCGHGGKVGKRDYNAIYRVMATIKQHGAPCFTTPALDSAVKGEG